MAAWRWLALSVVLASGCQKVDEAPGTETVMLAGHTFTLEVAADDASRGEGLAGRESVAEDTGMLFIFSDPAVRSFWMHGCLVDIDIIFLDPNGRITAMHRMKAVPPRGPDEPELDYRSRLTSYWSVFPAQFAIELRAGWLDRLNLRVDQKVELDLPRLKAMAR
ncbi:MAG: DUF192 domain-containing protein [Planctomycetota bacterium]|jgi:uncharacterized membrane protein (UPF0127 family)